MGLAIPRPAMRAAERRKLEERLRKHATLTEKFKAQGLTPEESSAKAYEEVTGKPSPFRKTA